MAAVIDRAGVALADRAGHGGAQSLGPWGSSRPLVEFYRRHTVVELGVPIS
ncbi:hypothetical protein SK803_16870 [Lentzea sp. BCCO 10_0856]|uniref:Uncharacterized protein n=1 Tax=Lentzea miocenica TaxID=3095431 RepID=A0ABU4T1E4_9PSEU|nr:hypothetical protein [Lentzea sp. BCCO 10_0856]